jgi:hypothetical protein
MAETSPELSGRGLEELKALLVQALEEVARLKAENTELREEIGRLKGLKGRPKLKPSGMEKATEAPAKGSGRKGRRGAKRAKRSSPSMKRGSSSWKRLPQAPASRAMKTLPFRTSS